MKDIKHTFNLSEGRKVEILLRYDDNSLYEVKKTYSYDDCFYNSDEYYLDSFDNSHHKDYPIEEVMESLISGNPIKGTDTFWNHP